MGRKARGWTLVVLRRTNTGVWNTSGKYHFETKRAAENARKGWREQFPAPSKYKYRIIAGHH